MNKSVLPISLDPVSFDSLSLSKPVKKPIAEALDKRDSFAEHLSQSQRELVKDKVADHVKEKNNIERPKARITTDHQSDKKNHLNQDVTDPRKIVADDASINTDNLNPAEEALQHSDQDLDQELSADTALVQVATDPVLLNPDQETSMVSTSSMTSIETEITDANLLAVATGDSVQAESELLVQPGSEIEMPLAETNEELLIKGVDAKTFTENYLKGIDTKPTQQAVTNTDETATIVDELAALSETTKVSSSETVINQPGVPVAVMVDPKLAVQPGVTSSASEMVANKTGIELPLTQGDLEEALDPAVDVMTLTGEIKPEDKSTKTDLFKSLLVQAQSEKPVLANEKPAAEPGLPTLATASTSSQVATANRLFVPQTQLGMNVVHPHWGNAMGEKILWMANQQLSSADIRLDPPELGSLQVRVSVQQDQANITFISPHPQVRELLDQQVTRLREMFAEQGLNLGQVDIADKREQQSDQSDEESKTKGRFVTEETEEVQVTAVSSLYLVDQFV